MTSIVGGLCTAFLERNELVSQIDERHGSAFASKFKIEQPTVESQSRFDVTDLESDMIETDDTRLCCFRHGALQHQWDWSHYRLKSSQNPQAVFGAVKYSLLL